MEDYKNEIEMLRQAFADSRTDEQIGMPDAEAELGKFIATHRSQFERKTTRLTIIRKIAALFLGIVMLSGFAYAAVRTSFFTQPWSEQPVAEVVEVLPEAEKGLVLLPCDTIPAIKGDVTFEDNELEEVLRSICNAYKVEIVFRNEEQKHILLHFSYNTEDKLQDVVDGLNLLKKFCLKQKDNKLTVE